MVVLVNLPGQLTGYCGFVILIAEKGDIDRLAFVYRAVGLIEFPSFSWFSCVVQGDRGRCRLQILPHRILDSAVERLLFRGSHGGAVFGVMRSVVCQRLGAGSGEII